MNNRNTLGVAYLSDFRTCLHAESFCLRDNGSRSQSHLTGIGWYRCSPYWLTKREGSHTDVVLLRTGNGMYEVIYVQIRIAMCIPLYNYLIYNCETALCHQDFLRTKTKLQVLINVEMAFVCLYSNLL